MKSVAVDAILHARAELIEEFKAGQHTDWDPDFEINVWKEREVELAEAGREGEAAVSFRPLRLRGQVLLSLLKVRSILKWPFRRRT